MFKPESETDLQNVTDIVNTSVQRKDSFINRGHLILQKSISLKGEDKLEFEHREK